VRIHPFADGNGRTTRFLADLVFAAVQHRNHTEVIGSQNGEIRSGTESNRNRHNGYGTLVRQSVGRGFEPRPPHVRGYFFSNLGG
jgi:hypothetical protein